MNATAIEICVLLDVYVAVRSVVEGCESVISRDGFEIAPNLGRAAFRNSALFLIVPYRHSGTWVASLLFFAFAVRYASHKTAKVHIVKTYLSVRYIKCYIGDTFFAA